MVWASWSKRQKYLISKAQERCRFIVLFTIPTAVVLSTWIGIGGCKCPNSCRVSRIIFACYAFSKSAPSSASAADAASILRTLHKKCIAPFRMMGYLFFGIDPRKKCPPVLLLALDAVM